MRAVSLKQPESEGKGLSLSTLGSLITAPDCTEPTSRGTRSSQMNLFLYKICQRSHVIWPLFYQRGLERVNKSHRTAAKKKMLRTF